MADLIAMFSRWAKSGLSVMCNRLCSYSMDWSSSSSLTEPTRRSAADDFQRIMRMLPRIEAVLRDAEERDIQDTSVSLWLSELRLLAYDIDDVVDEYEYEVLRAQIQAKSAAKAYHKRGSDDHHDEDEQGEGLNVLESSSSQIPSIPVGMAEKLRDIRERFEEIESDRKALRLRNEDGERRPVASWRPLPTSSLVDETRIIGREGDKEKIMKLLLSDSEHSNNIQVSNKIEVIPIVGMGGVGKTTLAQCIYNDPRICQYFYLRGWIYVSEDFDLTRLTKEIYRSITNKPLEEGVGFDHLQGSIKKELMRFKRTFLVLDDVWNEEQCLWQSLQAPFHDAGIVTILITTRNEKVANVMRTMNSFHLGYLSEKEGWRLFQKWALCEDENLIKIGKGIVRKCGGLPLAIKLLGSHLRFERDEDKWMSILESELWEVNPGVSEILPALRLSYQRMPSHLKPCFRYCSMFPKNEILDKNRLVWLWVAQGYIQAKRGKTLEEIAIDYFDELLGRSFLQVVENNQNSFKMHDLIFDLAFSIYSKEFIKITLERGKQNKFKPDNFRHLVIYDQRAHNGAKADTLSHPFLSKHTALRSIFYYGHNIIDIFKLFDSLRLRALHINISKYDLSISKFQVLILSLKHLRYLCVRNCSESLKGTDLLRCFNSFRGMYNVQVLDLLGYHKPLMLQARINDLVNLRHLFLPFGSFMPTEMSKLNSLQTLKHVIVKDGSHVCGGLSEIEELESLTGSCRIYNIKFATNVGVVKKANIKKKKHIRRLFLDWNHDDYNKGFDVDIGFDKFYGKKKQSSELAEALLEALRPHNELKELEIKDYPGIRFPLWFGDPSYSKLRDITFRGCDKWNGSCEVLDRVLPYLQSIFIIDCSELKNIKIVQSYSLKNLLVANCYQLSTLRGLCNLHVLRSLNISRCRNLLISAEERLPSKLKFVCFNDCDELTSITGLQNLEKLELKGCRKLQLPLDENLSILPRNVKVIDCPGLRDWCQWYGFKFNKEISMINELTFARLRNMEAMYGSLRNVRSMYHSANLDSLETLNVKNVKSDFPENECLPQDLMVLHISSCPLLKFLPSYRNLSGLRELTIQKCTALIYLPGLEMMKYLAKLEIMDCIEFTLSPLQRFPSWLRYLHIRNCPRLMWLPGLQEIFSLRHLILYECRELMLLPPEQLPFIHQVQLEIINCPKLKEWYQRFKELPKDLFVRSSQQINSWIEESVLFENICVLDYDEDRFETELWPSFKLLSLYVCSCVHLKRIKLCDNISRLKQLRIWNCSHLKYIDGLFKLTSLQEMDISNCPKLGHVYFPQLYLKIDFPAFRYLKISKCPKFNVQNISIDPDPLLYVEIRECPLFEKWCLENHIAYFQD